MCGIAGFVGHGDENILAAMQRRIAHRGPDDCGTYHDIDSRVYLGHRRLSILDLEGGHQPMSSDDGDIQVVFNGEIYNHIELRRRLKQKGHNFKTDHSDTEVLIHGYREWGQDLPEFLNGMFAFAIYDKKTKKLFLARDRFGEKPLYYSKSTGLFVFASELKAVLTHPSVSREISKFSMQKYFALGFIPGSDSIVGSVNKLQPGYCACFDIVTGKIKLEAYWQFKIKPEEKHSITDLSENLRFLVQQAVERRLMSDVPLGVFLSGGLDSTIMLSSMTNVIPANKISTFSIGFNEQSFDESKFAKQVSDYYGTNHHVKYLDINKGQELLDPVLTQIDEPLGDPSIIPTYLLAEFAREHVKVAIGGDGGDELFAGYDPFRAIKLANFYSTLTPEWLHTIIRNLIESLKPSDRNMSLEFRLKRTLRGLSYPPELWNPAWLGPLDPEGLSHFFGEKVALNKVYSDVINSWKGSNPGDNIIDKTLEFYTHLYLPNDILTKVDRATMMVSLEARAPFLDNDLVEFVQSLPSNYKLKGSETKFLLKHAFKEKIPEFVIKRPKKGFGIPLGSWLKDWEDTSFLDSLPHIDRSWLKIKREEHVNNIADHRQLLWCAISMDRFIKSISSM